MQGHTESVIILYQCDQNDVTAAAAAVIVTGIALEIVIAAPVVAVIVMVTVAAIEAVHVMARTS
jgi:hypothetical protein